MRGFYKYYIYYLRVIKVK